MFSIVIYLELFIALFFLPGFFLTVIMGIKKFRFLLSFALSYSLLVLTLLPFEYYAQPIARWSALVRWEWAILAVWAAAKTLFISPKGLSAAIRDFLNSRLYLPRLIVPLALAGVICGYLAYAGIYLEIPSDVWEQARRFQCQKMGVIDQGCFSAGILLKNIFLTEGPNRFVIHWYFIHAWICHVSGLAVMDSLHVLTFVNVLVFLLAIYYFGLYLFARLHISTLKKMVMAAFASIFTAATMGNMVFAYIRYYTFAPAILNYALFLAAMAVIIAWLRSNRRFGHALWIAPILLIVTSMIHTQELLFIFFMTLALSIVGCFSLCWRKFINLARHSRNQNVIPAKAGIQGKKLWIPISRLGGALRRSLVMGMTKWKGSTAGRSVRGNHWTISKYKSIILAASLLLVFFAGFIVIRYCKPGVWISNNMIMPHVGIPPESANFIFRKLMISPPENPWFRLVVYQLFIFYQVVGCWGLFVYLLFLLMIRHFVKIPYLMAGMIVVPLLTAFNPVTVDMMARMGQDMALYRFHYLIPLPFIGGYLFVHFGGKAREWFRRMRLAPAESVSPIWPRLSWLKFTGSIAALVALLGLVFPINTAGIYAPYSKIYTLRKIPARNDYRLWGDLGKVIEKHANKIILTDDLTCNILRWYLSANVISYSKWLNSSNPENEPPEPYTWESLRNRGLIIINRRNGAPSITGKIAKHWPEDVLNVSRYYSIQTQTYLESHPETFQKIWSRNRIAIYAVR